MFFPDSLLLRWSLPTLFSLFLFILPPPLVAAPVKAVEIVGGLDHPWSMAFLPEGEILVSERSGQLRRMVGGKLLPQPVEGVPQVEDRGQGGLLGLALHPQFFRNHWLYFAFTGSGDDGYNTHLACGRYQDGKLTDVQVLFATTPESFGGKHFDGRVVFDRQGHVYLSLGDRGQRENSQMLENHAGSLIRLHDDGRVPADNPFVNTPGAMPEIFNYGHRNIQGMAVHPLTGDIWTHEHGPQGGDEVNIERAGANYGWPVITYGEEYGGGAVGEGNTEQAGMEQPVLHWTPSITPSGMTFYTGDKYPGWQGSLFVGALKSRLISRITLDGSHYVDEEHLLKGEVGRIRDIQQGPEGYLYVLTDASNGSLYRLE